MSITSHCSHHLCYLPLVHICCKCFYKGADAEITFTSDYALTELWKEYGGQAYGNKDQLQRHVFWTNIKRMTWKVWTAKINLIDYSSGFPWIKTTKPGYTCWKYKVNFLVSRLSPQFLKTY